MTQEQTIVKRKKNKKQNTFYKVLGVIADIIIYPVVVISLLAAFGMLISNRNSSLPSFFGVSFVKVLSNSMEERGFLVNDVVFVKQADVTTLKVGDVVAFYKFQDVIDRMYHDKLVNINDYNGENLGQSIPDRTSIEDLKKSRPVFFHEIKNIYVLPNDGTLFFETGGAGEGESDGYIRADHIVGQYTYTPRIVRDVLKFCASQWGMIVLVVVPLSILILLECLSIVEQINDMIVENKVFNREERYDSKDSIKANIGEEMELHRQVYFYATTNPEERDKVKQFLWGNLYEKEITKKEQELKKLVDQSLIICNNDINQYFDFWLNNIENGFQKRKLTKLVNNYKVKISYDKTRE